MLTLIVSRFSVAMLNISKYKHRYTSLKTKPHQQGCIKQLVNYRTNTIHKFKMPMKCEETCKMSHS